MRQRNLDDHEVQAIRHGLEHVRLYASDAQLQYVSNSLLALLDTAERVTLETPEEARPTVTERLVKISRHLRQSMQLASRGWDRFEQEKLHRHVLVHMERVAEASFGILGDLEKHSPQILWSLIEDAAIRNQYPSPAGALDAAQTWELLQVLDLTEEKIATIDDQNSRAGSG